MKNTSFNWLNSSLALSICVFLCSAPSSASFLPPLQHQYLNQEYDATLDGGYWENVNGQEDLNNPNQLAWDSAYQQPSFIDKEMWLSLGNPSNSTTCNFGQSQCWIEAGDTQGGIGTQTSLKAWAGQFFAVSRNDGSYYEEPMGASGVTGRHTYEIAYGANGIWEIYVDGALVRQISSMSIFRWGYNLLAGIESDNTDNTFTTNTYQDSLEWRNSAGWNFWDVGTVTRDNMTYLSNAHSSFTYSGNPTATYTYSI